MCEYCGCQEIAVIDELTREHDAVVSAISDVRRALAAGSVPAAAEACRQISALLEPHTVVEEEGLFPCLAGEFPDHVAALREEHRSHRRRAGRGGLRHARGPHLAGPVARTLHALREHILKEQDGVFPAALGALGSEEWERIEGIRARVGTALPPTLHHHGQA